VARLDGKVCVVTGAASGIGRETARRFAREGARVACADVDETAGQEAAAELQAAGGEAEFFPVDVADERSVEALYDAVERRLGPLQVLVNNAGIMAAGDGSVLETDLAAWQRVLAVNLTGVFLCCKHGGRRLVRAGGGSIVNVASFVALMGAATPQIAYTASKGGVLSLTREVAIELADRGVRANALCPGPIETPLMRDLLADPAARKRRLVHIPSGRFGTPGDVADAALFLASDESGWITGTAVVVDGGITAAYVTPER
jgi:NAD(P)-dependent dehydrogenase (short-subunit alcohol dehydrogenase family)